MPQIRNKKGRPMQVVIDKKKTLQLPRNGVVDVTDKELTAPHVKECLRRELIEVVRVSKTAPKSSPKSETRNQSGKKDGGKKKPLPEAPPAGSNT